MSYPDKYSVTIVSANSSQDPYYTPSVRGYLYAVNYVAEATTPWPATADFKLETTDTSVICFTTAVQLTTAGWIKFPRWEQHNTTGGTVVYTTAGSGTQRGQLLPLCDTRLKFVVNNVTSTGMLGHFNFFFEGTLLEQSTSMITA